MFNLFRKKEKERHIKIWIPNRPWGERAYEVEAIFSELGILMRELSYGQIQEIVRERTGAKCSRNKILSWKKRKGYSKPHPLKLRK